VPPLSYVRLVVALLTGLVSLESQVYDLNLFAGKPRIQEGAFRTSLFIDNCPAIASDASGNIYFAAEAQIFKIDQLGIVHVFAGTGQRGYSGDNGPASQAVLSSPTSLAFDNNGDIFFSDSGRIRAVSSDGTITTVAGNGSPTTSGDGGAALSAGILPGALVVAPTGDIYFVDHQVTIRRIHSGFITTIAGNVYSSVPVGDGGPAQSADFSFISSLAFSPTNELFVVDADNHRIRVIDSHGLIYTIAGNGASNTSGDGGAAINAAIGYVTAIVIHNNLLSIQASSTIRDIDLSTGSINTYASSPLLAGGNGLTMTPNGAFFSLERYGINQISLDRSVSQYAGSGVNSNASSLDTVFGPLSGICLGPSGVIYVLDDTGVRGLTRSESSTVHTLGGIIPSAITSAADGTLFSAAGGFIYRTDVNGTITVIAGDGHYGSSGDGGAAVKAEFGFVSSMAMVSGNVVFVDTVANSIREVLLSTGSIQTIAGNGQINYSGDGGPAISAGMLPQALSGTTSGELYVVDGTCGCVRRITSAGIIGTVAGNGVSGFSGDGGPATLAQLADPDGIYVDAEGDVFIGDAGNSRIRMVTPDGIIHTIAGNGIDSPVSGVGGPAIFGQLHPETVTGDRAGNLYVTDALNGMVWLLTPFGDVTRMLIPVTDTSTAVSPGATIRLVVRAVDPAGRPVSGAEVSFRVVSGDVSLNNDSSTTGEDGTASTIATVGPNSGHSLVQASSPSSSDGSFGLTSALVVPPTINGMGVVGAGLSTPPVVTASPNAIVSIFGKNFAPEGTSRQVTSSDMSGGMLPTELGGVCVQIGGVATPVLYVSSSQINVLVPLVGPGSTGVDVVARCGTVQEAGSNSVIVTSQAASPEFFYFAHSSKGLEYIAALDTTTGLAVGPTDLGHGFSPAKPGDDLEMFFTGGGMTTPVVEPGAIATAAAPVSGAVRIAIDGKFVPESDVLYVGIAPDYAGLYQANIMVPMSLAAGAHEVQVFIGAVGSPQTGAVIITE